MLLYWGMFTAVFMIGAIFAYVIFASNNQEEDSINKPNLSVNSENNIQPQNQQTIINN